MRVSMTFATACVNSLLGFPALLHLLGAEVPSFRFIDEGANRAGAASAFRRTAQRRIDFADAPGAIQRRYGRPNVEVRQHITRTNDHPRPPGDGRPHRGFLYNPNLNKSLRYKGFGGYFVEGDPLRQWGQAQFRMNLRNRRPRSVSTSLQSPELPQRPARRLRIRQPRGVAVPRAPAASIGASAERRARGQADPRRAVRVGPARPSHTQTIAFQNYEHMVYIVPVTGNTRAPVDAGT
jgi:hypothetical protein